MDSIKKKIFRKASITHYYSSLFFPKKVREDVATVYTFLRIFDDYVDAIPSQEKQYYKSKNFYETANNDSANIDITRLSEHELIIFSFVKLKKELDIKDEWVESFFVSMEMDLHNYEYLKEEDTLRYIFGVAEVVGLMMAKVMNLTDESHDCARTLGRAGQYINMIRDIKEDIELNRRYFPKEHLDRFNLKSLDYNEIISKKEEFIKFINFELDKYYSWQEESTNGYKYIPKRYLTPIRTIAHLYIWTGDQIKYDPFIVYKKKVKPSKFRVLNTGLIHSWIVKLFKKSK